MKKQFVRKSIQDKIIIFTKGKKVRLALGFYRAIIQARR